MSFDPMAAAVDWLDPYRAGDTDAILDLHADDAVIRCCCGGMTIASGKEGLRAYWIKPLQYPASDLHDLQASQDAAVLSYVTPDGAVNARLAFNASGQIASIVCAPARSSRTAMPIRYPQFRVAAVRVRRLLAAGSKQKRAHRLGQR
jgi:SnoaL-like protein